jgi:hypothetical protein
VTGRLTTSPLAPWAGLFLGALAWFGQQQICASVISWDCRLGGPLLTAGLGALAAVITVAGGLVSWRAHRRLAAAPQEAPHSRSVAGVIGAGAAAVFLLAIFFQALTGVIVPACHR